MTHHQSANKQAGISLMLAVLVLAGLTAIAFSLATIVFIEVRSSGDVLRTEPALYATFGVTEEALFKYKRYVSDTVLDLVACKSSGLPDICYLNGVDISLPGQQPLQFDPTVPTVKVIPGGSREEVPLYLNDFQQIYSRVEVKVFPSSTSSPKISVRKTQANGAQSQIPASPTGTNPGSTFSSVAFEPNAQYDLIIDNSATGNADVSVAIYPYDTSGSNLKGVPYLGQNVLSIVAKHLGLTRTYRVQIPLSGGGEGTLNDLVWFDDALPAGAIPAADGGDVWNWIDSNQSPGPFTGTMAHKGAVAAGNHQHYFYNATETFLINPGDVLVTYVYIDPGSVPQELMIQFNNGSWEHRAYWGANGVSLIPYGTPGTDSKRYMGTMPSPGGWRRLEIPASVVGLEGTTLNGMAFTLWGGAATWDHSGKTQ